MIVPSPLPPYHREAFYVPCEDLTGDGTVSLDKVTTYLNSVTPKTGNLPFEVLIPDGAYRRQVHQFVIPKVNEWKTAAFVVRGKFVDYSAILLREGATSAVAEWDGGSWHIMGGNAIDEIGAEFPGGTENSDGMWVRVKNGKLQLKSPDDMKWYDAFPRIYQGAVSLTMEGQGETS